MSRHLDRNNSFLNSGQFGPLSTLHLQVALNRRPTLLVSTSGSHYMSSPSSIPIPNVPALCDITLSLSNIPNNVRARRLVKRVFLLNHGSGIQSVTMSETPIKTPRLSATRPEKRVSLRSDH